MTKEQQIKIQKCIDEFYSNRPQVRDELGVALQVLCETEPRKYGHWIWTGKERPSTPESIRCSECGFWYIKLTPRFYCSNCGAKMDNIEGPNENDRT